MLPKDAQKVKKVFSIIINTDIGTLILKPKIDSVNLSLSETSEMMGSILYKEQKEFSMNGELDDILFTN